MPPPISLSVTPGRERGRGSSTTNVGCSCWSHRLAADNMKMLRHTVFAQDLLRPLMQVRIDHPIRLSSEMLVQHTRRRGYHGRLNDARLQHESEL
jgi:hypothetical protein